jgi:protein-tyrosine phosphatase
MTGVEAPRWTYWVEPGRLLAGGYPGYALDAYEAARISLFVDLTEEHELEPYASLLPAWSRHVRHPIRDMGVCTPELLAATLDTIDAELESGGRVYVHCWAGLGRTGTIVGCWLARHGRGGDDPVERIAELRRELADAWDPSPQTTQQRLLVRSWACGD